MDKYYISYGSNLNKEEMKKRCPNAICIGTSFIFNYQLLFKKGERGSYLTIEKSIGSKVPIAIWQVSSSDEKALDIYEDYPSLYYKEDFEIKLANKTIKAFVYIMYEENLLGVPSKEYYDICLKGYKDFNFEERYLKTAYKISSK